MRAARKEFTKVCTARTIGEIFDQVKYVIRSHLKYRYRADATHERRNRTSVERELINNNCNEEQYCFQCKVFLREGTSWFTLSNKLKRHSILTE